MAKYKEYSYDQGIFLPVFFDRQILPGTFEYSLNHMIDNEVDLKIFDSRYKNDETGAPAYDPKILLKIILFAYSRGITSSRKIAQCCEENIIFMALSANTRPHFTTIADFISTMGDQAIALFREIILVCDEMGLIGKDMFAVDGCKLPSNASKEWSGTKADFKNKCIKLEKAIEKIIKRHRKIDHTEDKEKIIERDIQYIATLQKQIRKIRDWTRDNDDKPGADGKPIKSNITDNESARMKTSNGVAMTDSGFHTNKNMDMLAEQEIDGYIADRYFRKRDPAFDNYGRYKERSQKERIRREKRTRLFSTRDFTFDPDFKFCICPAGKRLYRSGSNIDRKGYYVTRFKGPKSACVPCYLRAQCLRHPDRTQIRQVAFFHERKEIPVTPAERMKQRIDSPSGKLIYSKRIGTVEPVFANIRHMLRLDRFNLRGKLKVNCQWLLFCSVHNLKKIHRYGSVSVT
jgi:transposase